MALQLPLDIVSTATCSGAYAAYRLSFSYTGATITVRRSSDNATSDFYANAYGEFGTTINGTGTTLESWLGTATGFVTKWYDQSGKGNHATQATTANQPRIDYLNNRLDFTTGSGTAFLSIPNGTVPNYNTYSLTGSYISTNSGARNTLISDNILIERIYDAVLTATVIMNGNAIGSNENATYMTGSRTGIANNEFSVLYSIYNDVYTKAAKITFRQIGTKIDCYQSDAVYWNGNVTGSVYTTSGINQGSPGSGGYGVVSLTVLYRNSYTVTVKHNTIGNSNGAWLTSGVSGGANNSTNTFRRDGTNYRNYWWNNDFIGNSSTYAVGNIVTYAYDGSYSYLYINGTSQGVSDIRSGWIGQPGNEFIGKSIVIPPTGEYFNGEMYSLFIFKSFLSVNDRAHIEHNIPVPNITGPIKFSQLKTALSLTSNTVSFSQLKKYAGIPSSSAASISAYDGFMLRDGLFMRFYSNTYFYNNVNFFNSNTPTITGVVTNLRNTYCATGGISNAGYSDNKTGNIAVMSVFSVEWFGLFYAPVTGTYTFYLLSDDTGIIWIGDNALSGYTTGNALFYTQGVYTEVTRTTPTELTAGTYYPFRFQYGAAGGDTLKFSFAPPGGTRVYDGTGYFFCQTHTNPNTNLNNNHILNIKSYIPFESSDVKELATVRARYVGFDYGNTQGIGRYMNLMGVSVFTSYNGSNIINTSMSVTSPSAITPLVNMTDNNDGTLFHTNGDEWPFVMIDLGSEQYVHKVQLHNRTDCCRGRIAGGRLFLRDGNNNTFYTSGLIATKGGLTTYQDHPSNDGYLYYTWWPSINTTPYGSDIVPYSSDPFRIISNGAKGYNAYALYHGATISTADYKLGSSSLSLTASLSQYAQISNFTPTTGGLTFAFWYKSNGSGTWARIFDFSNGPSSDNILMSPNNNGSGGLGFNVFIGVSSSDHTLSDINYNDNVWRHIVWTLSYVASGSLTSTWNLYVNGVNKYSNSTKAYPLTSVTRTLSYIGKSAWADAFYNGYIDEFRIYNSVLSATDVNALYTATNSTLNNISSYTYRMLNGSTVLTTTIQGTTPSNPATSGYAIYSANPWLPNGYYWIKSASMPNALQMFVDIKNGGYDFYQIGGGTSVNFITSEHSGTDAGLELLIPRSQDNWKAIYSYFYTTLGTNYNTWYNALPIYKTTSGGSYTSYAMFDQRFANISYTSGSYNGVPDWRCKDGGLWYIRDIPFGGPSGDYTANALLALVSEVSNPEYLTSYGAPGFNDADATPSTGTNYLVSTNYAGFDLTTLYMHFDDKLDGSTSVRAAPSAMYIKNRTGTNTNGVYWINLPTVGATQIFCIMDSAVDGGGWMMAMKATTGTTFGYDSSHWTTATTLNPTDNTRNNANAKFHSMNYFQCKDMLALWPDILVAGGNLTLTTYNNWCWLKNNYNSGTRQTLISYFSAANNVEFITMNSSAVKGAERGSVFSSQPGNSFYGINYTYNYNYRVRWGFAWNNENEWGSNDVSGGLGMYVRWGGSVIDYSAGDWIGCCQDQTGINRSARVEMYVR